MKKNILFAVFIFSTGLFAAEVLKVSKNKMDIAITHDLGSKWVVGQKICVQSQEGKSYCGQVVKVKEAGAICKMQSAVQGVAPGDEVTSEVSSENLGGGLESGSSEKITEPVLKNEKKESKKRKVAFGFRGGLVLGNAAITPEVDFLNRRAINFGTFLDIPLGAGQVSFEPGLAFVQKGYDTTTYGVGLNYIEMPLLLKVRLLTGNFTPVLFAGPYVSYLLSAKTSTSSGDTDVKNEFKTIDYGATGGLGFEFKIEPKLEMGLVGFYGKGLRNVVNTDTTTSGFSEVKNKVIQVLLYLAFQ